MSMCCTSTHCYHGHTNAYTNNGTTSKICYKIDNVENSKDTGESFHFNMKIFDLLNKKILYRSAGIAGHPGARRR